MHCITGIGSGVYGEIVFERNLGPNTEWSRLDNFGCQTSAELASLLGVRYNSVFETYHMPNDISLFESNPFPSGYGIILRFKRDSYNGWIGIESGGTRCIKYSLSTFNNLPAQWFTIASQSTT